MNTKYGRFFIVNDFDRPDENHITEKLEDGKHYYIHPELRDYMYYKGMIPYNPTPLEDFGLEFEIKQDQFWAKILWHPKATYEDGKPRIWQGHETFSFPYRKPTPIKTKKELEINQAFLTDDVTDDIVDSIENLVGIESAGWDYIDPKEIIAMAWNHIPTINT